MDRLNEQRKKIDDLDSQIMDLLDKRFDISLKVGQIKKQETRTILDSNREQEILDKTSNYRHFPAIEEVYKVIMQESKKMQ